MERKLPESLKLSIAMKIEKNLFSKVPINFSGLILCQVCACCNKHIISIIAQLVLVDDLFIREQLFEWQILIPGHGLENAFAGPFFDRHELSWGDQDHVCS